MERFQMGEDFRWILMGWSDCLRVWVEETHPLLMDTRQPHLEKPQGAGYISIPALQKSYLNSWQWRKMRGGGGVVARRKVSSPWKQLAAFLHWSVNTRWFTNSHEASELTLWRENSFWQYSEKCICLSHWPIGSWMIFQSTLTPLFSVQPWRIFFNWLNTGKNSDRSFEYFFSFLSGRRLIVDRRS